MARSDDSPVKLLRSRLARVVVHVVCSTSQAQTAWKTLPLSVIASGPTPSKSVLGFTFLAGDKVIIGRAFSTHFSAIHSADMAAQDRTCNTHTGRLL